MYFSSFAAALLVLGAAAGPVNPASAPNAAIKNQLFARGQNAIGRLNCAALEAILLTACQNEIPTEYYSVCAFIADAWYNACIARAGNEIPGIAEESDEKQPDDTGLNCPGSCYNDLKKGYHACHYLGGPGLQKVKDCLAEKDNNYGACCGI